MLRTQLHSLGHAAVEPVRVDPGHEVLDEEQRTAEQGEHQQNALMLRHQEAPQAQLNGANIEGSLVDEQRAPQLQTPKHRDEEQEGSNCGNVRKTGWSFTYDNFEKVQQ